MIAVPADFDDAARIVRCARTPQELFGADPQHAYRQLAKLVHPDHAPAARAVEASAVFARLGELWEALHGPALTLRTAAGEYRVGPRIAIDDVSAYFALRDGGLLKLARRPQDNDLIEREAEALARIGERIDAKHRAYVPQMRDSFAYRENGSEIQRVANVFGDQDGFYSLATVGATAPDGLDARDVAWMWRRLLVAMGAAHRCGVTHGAVTPDNVLIHTEQHGLTLVNWCFAVTRTSTDGGGAVPALSSRYRDWYAPEVVAGQPAGPSSDIYLASRCMAWLMGASAPAPLVNFVRGCALPKPAARPQDAWKLLAELDELLQRMYGPRAFRPFRMPADAPAWPAKTAA